MKRCAFILLILLAGCTKVVVHGRDYPMEPVKKEFKASTADTFKAAKQALEMKGYTILKAEESNGLIKTNWLPTKSSSHYVDLFDHRDYGTVGAYYQIEVEISQHEGNSLVAVSAPIRSITHKVKSAHFEEKKILDQMADLLRREDFEVTNVGADQ